MKRGCGRERENSAVHGLDKRPLSGWAVTSAPRKLLVIPITVSSSLTNKHHAKVLMKTIVAASRYTLKLLTTDREEDLPH